MKKRIFPLVAVFVLVLALPAYAASPYALNVQPYLSFSGTTATCSVNFIGDDSTDEADLTLTLYQGNAYIDSWSASGTNRVRISETCKVESGKTYKLVLTWSVNGKTQPAVSTTNPVRRLYETGRCWICIYADPRGTPWIKTKETLIKYICSDLYTLVFHKIIVFHLHRFNQRFY